MVRKTTIGQDEIDRADQTTKERAYQGYSGSIKDMSGKPMDSTPDSRQGGGLIKGGVSVPQQIMRKIDGWNGKD